MQEKTACRIKKKRRRPLDKCLKLPLVGRRGKKQTCDCGFITAPTSVVLAPRWLPASSSSPKPAALLNSPRFEALHLDPRINTFASVWGFFFSPSPPLCLSSNLNCQPNESTENSTVCRLACLVAGNSKKNLRHMGCKRLLWLLCV